MNFKIGQEYRSLIITGPNAGGKTIVLKTIGLLTLATMSGLHIAGDKGTEIAIFENVFVDIGDNQSIENALSTFSSHMKNLSEIMRMSNNNTLLLFDEIGAVQSQMKVRTCNFYFRRVVLCRMYYRCEYALRRN